MNILLKTAIDDRGWKYKYFAAQVGVTPTTLGNWIHEHNHPHDTFIVRICELLDKTPEELGLQGKRKKEAPHV